jgi:NAD(P)-dependent dehydrogenase (short-subunit alcohol dehydrogenase family)
MVAIADRNPECLERTVALIRRDGLEVMSIVADATRSADVRTMVGSVVRRHGALDVLYNNVSGGWRELGSPMHEVSADAQDEIVSNNLVAIVNLCRVGAEQMVRQGHGGSIINVSASRTVRRQANAIYAYTKAGIIELTVHMASDYARDGIRVNCIMPGLIRGREVSEEAIQPIRAQLTRTGTATERQGDPLDIAYAAVYLASNEASFVTGQCLAVDGGDDAKLGGVVIDAACAER